MERSTKNLYAYFDYWFYASTESSRANHSNFKFLKKTRSLCGNKIFIHPITNFYSILAQKNFLRIFDQWFYALNRPLRVMIQISNFEKHKVVSMFHSHNLFVDGCIKLCLIVHKIMNFIFFKKNIFTVDLESCTKISGVQW